MTESNRDFPGMNVALKNINTMLQRRWYSPKLVFDYNETQQWWSCTSEGCCGTFTVIIIQSASQVGVHLMRDVTKSDSDNILCFFLAPGVTNDAKKLALEKNVEIFDIQTFGRDLIDLYMMRGFHSFNVIQADKVSANMSKYPKILKNDPLSRYFALQRGDVIEFCRPSVATPGHFEYSCRVCV